MRYLPLVSRFSAIALLAAASMVCLPLAGNASPGMVRMLRIHGRGVVELTQSQGLLDLSKPFAIEAWFRLDEERKNNSGHVLAGPGPLYIAGDEAWKDMHKHVPATRPSGWVLRTGPRGDGNKRSLDFTFAAVGNPKSPDWTSVQTPPLKFKDAKTWHHVAVCRSVDSIKIYFDDEFAAEQSCKDMTLVPSPINVFLGASKFSPRDRNFCGDICGFRMSSSVRYEASFHPPKQKIFKPDAKTVLNVDFEKSQPEGITVTLRNAHGGAVWFEESIDGKVPAPGSMQELRMKLDQEERKRREEEGSKKKKKN